MAGPDAVPLNALAVQSASARGSHSVHGTRRRSFSPRGCFPYPRRFYEYWGHLDHWQYCSVAHMTPVLVLQRRTHDKACAQANYCSHAFDLPWNVCTSPYLTCARFFYISNTHNPIQRKPCEKMCGAWGFFFQSNQSKSLESLFTGLLGRFD